MRIEAHNPYYKLVGIYIKDGDKLISLVYGISNEGDGEGLEAYYYKRIISGHYRSYRWEAGNIPKKYIDWYNELKKYADECPKGHKISFESEVV